ncbi:bifunctional diguanylate cyclase/phosphodiesterase [Noviherbaspirillum suwonense]|uniref:Diguanylate cyclase (GGDEF) domain-containing protein n=1 Tax=Noviherbaspirillum suwonense TaxID=1224511 RepID=A0ABY1QMY1_9BURK|nr:EAL domain-containing protein [Noviherbaspirillum suwonense]SMP75217.1 diguanylate cyclase (GGDEF) domain-containing protein [Noviherbaspirillum suwonense]
MKHHEHIDTISAELEKSCALEQIHLLGTVQPHGFLMVADLASERIVQVSSGIVRHWPGLADGAVLIGQPLAEWVDGIGASSLSSLPAAYPLTMAWRLRFERSGGAIADSREWECVGHRVQDYAVLEWLPSDSSPNENHLQNRTLTEITRAINRLRHADKLDSFFSDCVKVVQEFSGFDRVMIYRFLPDGCGEVVAEHTSPAYRQRFLGLRFPASDIPSQARRLYLTNRLRILADVEAPADTLAPSQLPDGSVLDQSQCLLRGLSPVHLSYLRNMGVRATLTLSLVCDDKLWGLIACHHHEPRVPPQQVREGLRQICELVAEISIMRIESLSKIEMVRTRLSFDLLLNQVRQALSTAHSIPSGLDACLPDLLKAFQASSLGLRMAGVDYVGGPGRHVGPARAVLDEVAEWVDTQGSAPRAGMWEDVLADRQRSLAGLPDAAGLLVARHDEDEMSFAFATRPEVGKQVRWGGKPHKPAVRVPEGTVRLEPRRSFAEWKQALRGHSEAWTAAEAEGLTRLVQVAAEVHKLHLNRKLQKKLHWRAHHDQLTGLLNRQAMEEEVSRRFRLEQFNCALLLLDLDNFKKINDTHGHGSGDILLQELSKRLGAAVTGFDLLARLGGDEFMALMRLHSPDASLALSMAEGFHRALGAPFDINDQQVSLSISIGIALPPQHGRTMSELMRRADLAMYHAKSLGRSRSVVFETMMESNQLEFYRLEHDLDTAVEKNQLVLAFQPKVDLLSGHVVGLEALVRWNHPSRGYCYPKVFISVAERSDQIIRIDRWVMRAAIEAQAKWLAAGRTLLPIAINLSMADILSTDMVGYLDRLLAESGVPAGALEVEVTESSMMGEPEKTKTVMQALNLRGIATTLDDFGTGFSSLSYLRQLPLQSLKIDQSFIQSMLKDGNAEKLTQTIIAMGLALEMRVVAEGVETMEQMRWLVEHGCLIGQGYFFSPPVSADNIHGVVERIEQNNYWQ